MSNRSHRGQLRALGVMSAVAGISLAAGVASAHPPEPTIDMFGVISQKVEHRSGPHVNATRAAAPTAGSTAANASPIRYNNGPIMQTLSQVVVIWYGNWGQATGTDTAAGQQIIRDALYGLSATPTATTTFTNYAGITTGAQSTLGRYTQTGGAAVNQLSATIKEFNQPISATYGGYKLTDATVQALVTDYIKLNGADANAIYLVLSSSDVAESSGFLTKYCGWHTYTTVGTTTVKYGFIGNPNKTLTACNVNTAGVSPNGNPAVDAMISVIAHELEETVSDPQLNAWYNAKGSENGDMCAWTFGSKQSVATNGSYYNVTLPTATGGTRNYLLQRALASSNSKCYINATGQVQ
jgi:Phosphate-induced protein 1 conserved region